jgi:hypothetical protein
VYGWQQERTQEQEAAMLGSDVLEVGIGLILMYFLLSTICSAINELIAGLLHYRARMLERGILAMLKNPDLVEALYSHPLVDTQLDPGPDSKAKPARSARHKPSYMSARTFTLTLLDVLRTEALTAAAQVHTAPSVPVSVPDPTSDKPQQASVIIRAFISSPAGKSHLGRTLMLLMTQAESEGRRVDAAIEEWYDDTMQRVSGWYKREIQVWLTVIALAVSAAIGADTLALAGGLWHDSVLRDSISGVAQKVASGGAGGTPGHPFTEIQAVQDQINALNLPLGWSTLPTNAQDWLLKVLGILLTTAALTLGAPFWFDLLNKVANLRAAGPKPSAAPQPAQAPAAGTTSVALESVSG